MKIGLLITTYNRTEYLKECLESIKRSDLSYLRQVMIVDDCSSDHTIKMINDFNPKANTIKHFKKENKGIKDSLLIGCESLFKYGMDIVINLDGDAIVRNDFINQLYYSYLGGILTGFHCTTKNADGSERHKILESKPTFFIKESVGGINMCFDKVTYENFIKPALLKPGNWDHEACKLARKVFCLKESVVQHIGLYSSMGHEHDRPDVAEDFKSLFLPHTTLIGVDCENALNESSKNIKFGNVKLLPKMPSKAEYNKFILKEFYKFVDTPYLLIVQNDGYILNWRAWSDDFMRYDYIGAPWFWYKDGLNVGNGGFSFRSKRLHDMLGTDNKIQPLNDPLIHNFEEDHNICRIYRKYLELTYHIRFAPIEVASKFSIEGYPGKVKYSGQFGFHGYNVIK